VNSNRARPPPYAIRRSAQDNILCRNPVAQLAIHFNLKVWISLQQALRGQYMLHFAGAIPNATLRCAGVAVWLSPQTTVMPGCSSRAPTDAGQCPAGRCESPGSGYRNQCS